MTSSSANWWWAPGAFVGVASIAAAVTAFLEAPRHSPAHLCEHSLVPLPPAVTILPPRPYDWERDGDGWPLV